MKKLILSIVLFSLVTAVYSATVTVNNSGFNFTPAAITINLGDDVKFVISNSHDVLEVSEATYTANGNTPLAGGFSTPFGGGLVPASKLTVGTHYYVCVPHASGGMKGTIVVQTTTSITEKHSDDNFSVFPNPSNGDFNLKINTSKYAKNYDLAIYDVKGKAVYGKSDVQQTNSIPIGMANMPKGTYFVKIYNKSESYTRKIVIR